MGKSVLVRSGISRNKLFEQPWRGAGVPTKQWPPCSAAEGTTGGLKVPGIAQPAGRVGAVVLVTLMRFLSLRLKPKAATAPKRGRGPWKDDAGAGENVTGPETLEGQSLGSEHTPKANDDGAPRSRRDPPGAGHASAVPFPTQLTTTPPPTKN